MNSAMRRTTLSRAISYSCQILVVMASSVSGLTVGMRLSSDTPPTVSMVVQTGAAMNYWPHWRGPSVQGIVEGKGYPDRWSETDDVLWRVPVPGRGHSSPIIWDDRIFLTTAAADGSRRSVLCFRRSDGKQLWEIAVPPSAAEKLIPKNSYASSSPTTDGELVYAYFGSAGIVAINFSGKLIWHVSLGEIISITDRAALRFSTRTGSFCIKIR